MQRDGTYVKAVEEHVHHDEDVVPHLRRGDDRLPPELAAIWLKKGLETQDRSSAGVSRV